MTWLAVPPDLELESREKFMELAVATIVISLKVKTIQFH
jgi:hypothetical protein